LLVNPDVILGHMPISKPLFEFAAAARTTDLLNFPHRFYRAVNILDDKTCLSFNDNFGDRVAGFVLSLVSPIAQAVSPPPDGGYPDDNTAEGTDALFKLTSGIGNTAIGFQALALQQHNRQQQHGHRCVCAIYQHHWSAKHGKRC
jgi:hypothetical protein